MTAARRFWDSGKSRYAFMYKAIFVIPAVREKGGSMSSATACCGSSFPEGMDCSRLTNERIARTVALITHPRKTFGFRSTVEFLQENAKRFVLHCVWQSAAKGCSFLPSD